MKDQFIGLLPVEVTPISSSLNDTGAVRGYYIDEIEPLWQYTEGEGVDILIADTGASTADAIPYQSKWNFTDEEGFDDLNFHGSHVSGIPGSNHKAARIAIWGICPAARYHSAKVLESSGSGRLEYIKRCLRHCLEEGVFYHVVNFSLDIPTIDQETEDLLKALDAKGTLICCSAGNSYSKTCGGLASSDFSLATGSLDEDGSISDFSDRCDEVDLYYFGRNVVSFGVGNVLVSASGTSMSNPATSGVAGLLFSHAIRSGYGITNKDVKNLLTSTADSYGEGPGLGHGKMNPNYAMEKLNNIIVGGCDGTCDDCKCKPEQIEVQAPESSMMPFVIALVIVFSTLAYAIFTG